MNCTHVKTGAFASVFDCADYGFLAADLTVSLEKRPLSLRLSAKLGLAYTQVFGNGEKRPGCLFSM